MTGPGRGSLVILERSAVTKMDPDAARGTGTPAVAGPADAVVACLAAR
jgi:hypothetical protein